MCVTKICVYMLHRKRERERLYVYTLNTLLICIQHIVHVVYTFVGVIFTIAQFIHSSGKGHLCVYILYVKMLWHLKIGSFHNPPRIDPFLCICLAFCLVTIFPFFFFRLCYSQRVDAGVSVQSSINIILRKHHFIA